MKNVIVLFGKPGAGKGTRLSEYLEGKEEQFDVLAVSGLLRKARQEQTELGKKVGEYMDSGQLVPDEIINQIVIEGIKKSDKIVMIDGFPRTVKQAYAMLDAGIYPDKVVYFDVSDSVVLQRARDRIVCLNCGETYTTNEFKPPKLEGICDKCGGKLGKRKDDDEYIVKQRLEVYKEQTAPVLKFFSLRNIRICRVDNTYPKTAIREFKEIMDG